MVNKVKTLARFSSSQLERFLVEFANLQDDFESIRRLLGRFTALIPSYDQNWIVKLAEEKEDLARQLSELPSNISLEEIGHSAWILALKPLLCNLWIEPDPRQREWEAFAFRYALYKERDLLKNYGLFGMLREPAKAFRVPPPTPFEQALAYLLKHADRARYCANPECPAPYFFVKRKNQRYCSEICAAPAQRELKRKWWSEHGEEWRTARQKKSSQKVASKGKSSRKQKQTVKKGR